jgi:hypothetical protein
VDGLGWTRNGSAARHFLTSETGQHLDKPVIVGEFPTADEDDETVGKEETAAKYKSPVADEDVPWQERKTKKSVEDENDEPKQKAAEPDEDDAGSSIKERLGRGTMTPSVMISTPSKKS